MKADTWDEIRVWENTLGKLYGQSTSSKVIYFDAVFQKSTNDYRIDLVFTNYASGTCYKIELSDSRVLEMIEGAAAGMHERASELNEMVIEYRKGA